MSNKKISELELVASNASGDQFALVQNGETMKTTMSKIATFLGTIFTTVSAVTAQITAALVGYATEAYVDTEVGTRQLNYDLNNTATGPRAVTINALSGVAVFTSILGKKDNAYHDINNSLIEGAETKVECNLYYAGAGYPILMHYRTEAGKIRFHIGNVAVDGGAGTDTNANMEITFRIIEAG
jgi:hypothetical protein